MPWGAAAAVGASLVGGMMQGNAAKGAAQTQADASLQAANIQAQQRQPWVDAGTKGLAQLQTMTGTDSPLMKGFTMADAQNGPAMQQALASGTEAIQNSAAAKGGLLSSNTLEGLSNYGQATGAQYENQAFNQWLSQNQLQLGAVESLSQTGVQQAGQVADAYSNAALTAGGANAAAQMVAGNAVPSAINAGMQQYQMQQLLNSGGGGSPSPTDMSGFQTPLTTPQYTPTDGSLSSSLTFGGP